MGLGRSTLSSTPPTRPKFGWRRFTWPLRAKRLPRTATPADASEIVSSSRHDGRREPVVPEARRDRDHLEQKRRRAVQQVQHRIGVAGRVITGRQANEHLPVFAQIVDPPSA